MKTLGSILLIPFLLWMGIRIVYAVQFDRNCGGYLKRAADANIIPLAKQELGKSLKYIEENGLTSGYTSVIYRTPDEDIGFWYSNLRSAMDDLNQTKPDATQLEKSNVLIKLRETLLDHSSSGVKITVPDGISVFPNNMGFAVFGILSLCMLLTGITLIVYGFDND